MISLASERKINLRVHFAAVVLKMLTRGIAISKIYFNEPNNLKRLAFRISRRYILFDLFFVQLPKKQKRFAWLIND